LSLSRHFRIKSVKIAHNIFKSAKHALTFAIQFNTRRKYAEIDLTKANMISKQERTELKARIARGDYRRAAKLYKAMTGKEVSAQYLEHYLHDRREVTGLSGRHSGTDMYNALYITVESREARERMEMKMVALYRANVAILAAAF